MNLFNRFTNAANSFYSTWVGLDKPPAFFNTAFFDLKTADEKRVERYQKFWKYYNGEHEKFLEHKPNKPDDNVILNYSKRLVNKSNNFLFGKPLSLDISEYENTALEELLDKVFYSEEWQQTFFTELGLNGSVTGDFYIQMQIDESGIVHPVNLDPKTVFPRFEANNYHNIISYDIRWLEGKDVWRILHQPINPAAWSVEYQVLDDRLGRWLTDDSQSYTWEYSFPMIIKGKNLPKPNSAFGYSDLEDADINDYINLASSNMNKVIRLFAHPILWGRNFNLDGVDLSSILMVNDEKATLEALELSRDMTSAKEYISSLKTAFHEINSIPESDPEKMKIGAQSGFALNVLNNDLMLKTGVKRSLYGMAIKEFCTKAFHVMGYNDVTVKLHWQNPLPIDLREQTDSHRFDLESQLVSKKTLAAQRGYDYEEEINRQEHEVSFTESLGSRLLRNFERGITNA